MEKLVYQKFVIGCQNINDALSKGLGGVIFFTKDIQTEEQFKNLIKQIRSKALIPPFISIDQEGGRVERTENIRPKRLSAQYAFQNGIEFLSKQSKEISKELSDYGINLNFAPCVDVNTNPNNPIIGERAFSNNPEEVIKAAHIFIEASRKYNIIPCIKHFPGHGDADKDSHIALPVIELSLEEMKNLHIKPFQELISNSAEMIMVAHLHCKCFDLKPIPTSLSNNAIGYLRKELNYDGVIITDDMIMNGVQNYDALEACIMAIKAGVDMFIFRNSDNKTLKLINELVRVVEKDEELKQKVEYSYSRILRLKRQYGIIS